MLLLAIYLVLRKHKRELLGDAALGITLGLLFMTRHITLVIIPVFALVWIMKQKELGKAGNPFLDGVFWFQPFSAWLIPPGYTMESKAATA